MSQERAQQAGRSRVARRRGARALALCLVWHGAGWSGADWRGAVAQAEPNPETDRAGPDGSAARAPSKTGKVPATEWSQTLRVDSSACGTSGPALAFAQSLHVELTAAAGFLSGAAPADRAISARLAPCDIVRGQVTLVFGSRSTQIDVSDVPPLARPRTAAVSVAETLRWWSDPGAVSGGAAMAPDGVRSPSRASSPPWDGSATVRWQTPPSIQPTVANPEPGVAEALGAETADLGLGLRGLVMGPEQSLLWGIDAHLGWRTLEFLRTEVGVGYLTASDQSVLGTARLHALTYRAALEAVFGHARTSPFALQAHAGLGVEGLSIATLTSSSFGFDEPTTGGWALLALLHGTLVAPLHESWRLSLTGSLSKDVVGVDLQAGGEGGFSVYGLGVNSRVGVSRAF